MSADVIIGLILFGAFLVVLTYREATNRTGEPGLVIFSTLITWGPILLVVFVILHFIIKYW